MKKALPHLLSAVCGLLFGIVITWILIPQNEAVEQNTASIIDPASYNALLHEVEQFRNQTVSTEKPESNALLSYAEAFMQAYFTINAENGFNSAQFYEQYKPYLTEHGKSQLAPLNPELNKTDSISYRSEIVQKTVYVAESSDTSGKAAALLRISTSVEHNTPTYTLQFVVLDMQKQENGGWLVNDVLIQTQLEDEYLYQNIF